jgi:hypothetical protein
VDAENFIHSISGNGQKVSMLQSFLSCFLEFFLFVVKQQGGKLKKRKNNKINVVGYLVTVVFWLGG